MCFTSAGPSRYLHWSQLSQSQVFISQFPRQTSHSRRKLTLCQLQPQDLALQRQYMCIWNVFFMVKSRAVDPSNTVYIYIYHIYTCMHGTLRPVKKNFVKQVVFLWAPQCSSWIKFSSIYIDLYSMKRGQSVRFAHKGHTYIFIAILGFL